MRGQGCTLNSWSGARQAYALRDVVDDTCEAIFIQIDFLVVWDLTDSAVL